MPDESTKAVVRRMHTPGFVTRYFVGDGIDIGSGGDTVAQWHTQFPGMLSVKTFDNDEKVRPTILGDANTMDAVVDEAYDFVHSAHCLEHMDDPKAALLHWWRILKPGGHLIVIVPDEDMYEMGVWPSRFNTDHRASFTTRNNGVFLAASVNVLDLVLELPDGRVVRIELLEGTYRPWITEQAGQIDQTVSSVTEAAIEFVVRKGQSSIMSGIAQAARGEGKEIDVGDLPTDDMPDPVEPDTDEAHQADVDELEQFDREDE